MVSLITVHTKDLSATPGFVASAEKAKHGWEQIWEVNEKSKDTFIAHTCRVTSRDLLHETKNTVLFGWGWGAIKKNIGRIFKKIDEEKKKKRIAHTLWRMFVCKTDCKAGKRARPKGFDSVASGGNGGELAGCWDVTYIAHNACIRCSNWKQ